MFELHRVELTGVPDDANDLRGHHFKRLMRMPVTLIVLGSLALIVGIACAVAIAPAVGLIGAGAVLLLGPLVVLVIADSKAAHDFFEVYAAQLVWPESTFPDADTAYAHVAGRAGGPVHRSAGPDHPQDDRRPLPRRRHRSRTARSVATHAAA